MDADLPAAEIELLRRIAQGDRDAFARFYDQFAPLAFGLIRRILPQGGDAEEVLQEVFWEIWRVAPDYDGSRGTVAAWVVTRARSRAIDRLRAIRRREEVSEQHVDSAGAPHSEAGGDPAARVPDRDLLRGMLGTLAPAQREVVELAYFQGLTHVEIAARLRQPLGTVKTRMRAALRQMRELVDCRGWER